ncbi:hypothetical protein F2P81_020932 [Scophthalmus maximus]|uniref:Transmembrane protein 163 n=1 Tax=Scophthalmus maximus TaxID=52904 RepID=A0A6A4S1Q4_SCOMX|nr:hypothetical protein F2P81_020932 [Scophthalmus maximus]
MKEGDEWEDGTDDCTKEDDRETEHVFPIYSSLRFGFDGYVRLLFFHISDSFEASLDVLSSIIVLWRYSNAAAVHSAHREYILFTSQTVTFSLLLMIDFTGKDHDVNKSGFTAMYSMHDVNAASTAGFNSLVGAVMGFSILVSAEVYKHHPDVWFLDGSIGILISLIICAYGVKLLVDMVPRVRQTRNYERFE